jgi:hypothetical protein
MEGRPAKVLRGENLASQNILSLIKTVCKENYGEDCIHNIETIFHDVEDLFSGKRKGFQQCDTKYHDLIHTLQVIPPFIGILDGWEKGKKTPAVSREFFDLGVIAVLLHDTGYIKREDDIDGTGAKYTFVHTGLSADFAGQYLSQMGFESWKILSVRNIIMCTGVRADYDIIVFGSDEERLVGYALGTADLLGQMSAADYFEKLPLLYEEFKEAYEFVGVDKLRERGTPIFKDANDLIKNTPYFYEAEVQERFRKMGSVFQYLTYHFKDSKNHYIEAIEENIKKIRLRVTSR